MKKAPSEKILLVDDVPANLAVLTAALEPEGYEIFAAQTGVAALKVAAKARPDLILLDIMMPELDGFETCRRLKRDAGLDNVPIIFMTGLAETEHIVRGLEAGGVDYVTKPIAIEEMLARIRVHIANARLTQSARAALDVSGRYLLAVNDAGKIMWATPQAQKGKAASKAAMASFPSSEQLRLQYMGKLGPNEFLLRLAKDSGADAPAEFSSELGLTTREGEVLSWLSKGKTNRDIAQILGLSPRTVDKHLEQIYSKLGVENRTAAAAIAVNTKNRKL